MNQEFPPLPLVQPVIAERRKDKPRMMPTPAEVIARRSEIAKRLREQVAPLAAHLRSLSDVERKAVFYKLEHEAGVDVGKLGLKPISEPTEHFTIAIPPPRTRSLDGFERNLGKFETGPVTHRGTDSFVQNSQMARIQTIAEGQPKDRLSQELFDAYETLIKKDLVLFEVEMLSVAQGENQRRDELQAIRHALVREIGVQGTLFEHEEIKGTCRAVVRCTGSVFQSLVEGKAWQTSITWFESRPEFQTFHQVVENFDIKKLGMFSSPSPDASIVCVVDTGVTPGNPFLRSVTKQELLKSFLKKAPDNSSDEYGHGSGVASLVSYYALNLAPGAVNEGRVWVAAARVLNENNECEEGELFSKTLEEAVSFFAPLGVKIFNLSVNVRNRLWNQDAKRTVPRRSWIARKIDHLSREKDIVFVVSTGNIPALDIRHLIQDGHAYPAYLSSEEAAILDPAQAALALTVGSIAPTTLAVGPVVGRARAIAEQGYPSPFTRCGPGVRRDIKPELVDYGGNYLLDEEGGQVRPNTGVSVAMASNKLTPAVVYDAGTSFAAPRVAHKLARVQRDLQSLGINATAALLKAVAVNSATQTLDPTELQSLSSSLTGNGKPHLNILGYGMPDADRATDCDAHSVVLYYQGELTPDHIAYLEVPVPANLENSTGAKRLTVTVVHQPEVQRWGLEQYLGTVLKWRMFRGDTSRDEVTGAMSLSDDDEADQPDLPHELPFNLGIQQRSRGTVQHDITEWKNHKATYSSNHYTLAIAAYEKWGRTNPPPIPFAVVVRLEDTARSAEIYSQVKNALISLEIPTRTGTAPKKDAASK